MPTAAVPSCPHWSARTRNSGSCAIGVAANPSFGYCKSVCYVTLGLPRPPARSQPPTAAGQVIRQCCGHSLLHGAAGLIKYAMGLDAAPRETVRRRRDICRECSGGAALCPACTCLIRAKTASRSEECPLGKWGRVAEFEQALFLPFVGEFGHEVMAHVPFVHRARVKHKIVCCRPGNEACIPAPASL